MPSWKYPGVLTVILALAWCGAAQGAGKPNIVLIMADDMGFADTSPYGGEIHTPNIAALANAGVRYTHMYNTSRCSTTRATLLSGQYSHNVGMGHLPSTNYSAQNGGTMPGYSGWFAGTDPVAPDVVPTLPEVLKTAGYDTYMTGKWHLTRTNTLNGGPNGTWPQQRGFDKFYGTMEGAKDYFSPTWLVDTDTASTFENTNNLPNDYFYTNAIAGRGAQYIRDEAADGDDKPFFLYQSFYAPHFPLQAPSDATDAQGNNLVDKYKAVYAAGWDTIRQNRFANQVAMELFGPDAALSDKGTSDGGIPDWNTLSQTQKDDLILRMAVYAAQVEILDQGVGSIMDAVRDPDGDGDESDSMEDDTVFVFLSDNGAQGGSWDGVGDVSNWDSEDSAVTVQYGNGWANVSDTPFRKFKADTFEGGIASPLIISGYGVDAGVAGDVDTTTKAHVIDLMPTFMAMAGVDYPLNADAAELEGVNLSSSFDGSGAGVGERELYFEHEGNRAAIVGDWKIVAVNGSSNYQLFDLSEDRAESNDLSQARPELERELRVKWEAWAQRNQVATPTQANAGSPFLTHEEIDWIGQKKAAGDALMLHFNFDADTYTDGANVTDASGNGFVGLFAADDADNHAVDVDGEVAGLGRAVDLTHDIVDIAMNADIPIGRQARSFAVWLKADGIGNKRIFGYGDTGDDFAPGSLMLLTMDGSDVDDAVMKLRLGTVNLIFDPGDEDPIGVDQWIHAVLVVGEDATTTEDITMFINGVEIAAALDDGDSHVDLVTGLSYLTLGRRGGSTVGGVQGSTYDFEGLIGDFQVYGQPLGADQIAFLYDHPGQALPEPASMALLALGGLCLMPRRRR